MFDVIAMHVVVTYPMEISRHMGDLLQHRGGGTAGPLSASMVLTAMLSAIALSVVMPIVITSQLRYLRHTNGLILLRGGGAGGACPT